MGTWSLLVVLLISCAASLEKKCPSNILNKFLSDPRKAKEHYDNGETVSVTCLADSGDDWYDYSNDDGSDGLDTKNIRVLNCTDGKWIGHYPECFSNCSKPDIYAIMNPEYEVYAPGDNVTITACKKDNARIEGDTTLICMADGIWIGSAKCPKQHNSCNKQPPTISNAYITDAVLDEYKHDTVLRYKCSQAFDQMVKHSVTCNDGHWIPDSANLTICIIGHCSHIDSREIGNMHVKKISGQVGTYAEFECYDGYELDGSANILCMADRKWYPEIPKCKPISCPPPKQILNGRLIQEAYNGLLNIYQSTIRYDCDMGYRIVGPRFRKCQSDRTWSGNDTKCEEIVCEKPSPPENGAVYLTDNSQKVGSQIEYICDEHHVMEPIASKFAICTVHGHWSSPQPRCIKICNVPALSNGEIKDIFGRKIKANSYVLDNTKLIFTCNNGYEMYAGGNESQGRLKCFDGALHPGSPECRPQRCFMKPPINLEYFIGQEKVLENYIHSGTEMNARCSNRTELFRFSSYLEREQVSVQCNFGKLEPGSLVCKDKRCNITTTIDNDYFRNRSNVLATGEKILSDTYIQMKCSKGYELYNKTNSMYLDVEQRDIKCYQGSFTSEIPSCEPKRCFIELRTDLEYFIGQEKVLNNYILSGTEMNVRCSNRTELFVSSSYLEREQVYVKCNLGKLESELPVCKDKMCQTIDVARNITGFIVSETKTTPEEFVPHNQSIEIVCGEGYRPHGIITCNAGIWMGNSTCEPDVAGCVLKDPGMHFISLGNRTVLTVGENANVSCKFGYEIVGNISAKSSNEYVYPDPESTADPSEMSETGDNKNLIAVSDGNYTCIDNGKWEPELRFSCKPISCPAPKQILNGRLIQEAYNGLLNIYQSTVRYDCDKERCNINTTIDNGHFINSGKDVVTGEKILSGSNIKLICFEGYELYNKTNSMYIDLEQTDIKCYQGSFTSETLSCEPKRCNITQIQNGKLVNGENVINPSDMIESNSNITLVCYDGFELYNESISMYLESEKTDILCYQGSFNVAYLKCNPKMCKTIDVARNITGFIVKEKKTTPGEFVPHNQSIQTVCGKGYRQHGILTCNAGKWMGNSTCEPDVTGCVLKDPGMHFISLGNRTVLKVGEKANVSCKFGYEIVPNISAKGSYEYHYPDSESSADPSEMPETEDNENRIAVSDGNYTCIDNGKWERELRFSCKQIMCESFYDYNLENGNIIRLTDDVDTVGTVVSFQCHSGYTRQGPETRTCQIDGTWSGECVTCQRDRRNASITCPAPCVPEGAIKDGPHTYEIGSILKFYCTRSKTQNRDDRNNIRHCIKYGKYASWNGTKINCKEIICATGDHYGFENGKVTYSSSIATVGTEASFVCNPGYNLHGPMIRICQENVTWSGECVTCQKHQPNSSTCPAPCVPDGAKKIGSLSYEIGSRIQLYCFQSNMNYTMENSYIRHCVNDGKTASWNGTNINCKAKCEPLTDKYNVVQTGVLPGILSDKTVVELNCNGSLAKVQAECRKGHWHPKKPTCKYTCSLSAVKGTRYNYKVTKDQVFHGPIESGRQIKVTCEDGYFPNTQNKDVSRCVNGVWKPKILKCEKTDNF